MSKLVLEISSELADAMRVAPEEQETRLRRELAIRLYQKVLLSFGKARELARMGKWDFHVLQGEEGVDHRYDTEELQRI